ncbi:MAG TPA: biotin carboxylase N-terminal domain-containing protein [Ramlibacter sp.]|nr:biotin carboxylase N-terminal domain-containing protein [Ramlibacter sp.]
MRRILIANRGEIARRVIRTCERLGIETVAVYSDADGDALHAREATFAHALGGNASSESYLRIDKIIAAARATQADAVHPGYGFLSENAEFAQAVVDAGLVWIGPPPAAIRALGSKSSAKAIAQQRGVPCLPGYFGGDQSDECFAREAQRVGFPLMVKAAAGGGGRGMRLVTDASQLRAALQSARSEAQSSFGSGELLVERALLAPRHVEVQVFADAHGNCIHLGERDCSVQRRHQKLVEETPSPAVDDALRERMGACAVDLAKAAGYVGAGTVEFLVEPSTSSGRTDFFLMEMNTRLQVEHPVTEMVTGLDLVEWQVRVARGEHLPLKQEQVRFEGHAIEVRLCAEDENFAPHAGTIAKFAEVPDVRFDHAIYQGLAVPPYYDSMLGKLIVHAASRGEAIDQLASALDRLTILGLPTNRRLLAACLRHPKFRAGEALIPFLADHSAEIREQLAAEERDVAGPAAAAAFSPRSDALPCPFSRPLRVRHRGERVDMQSRAEANVMKVHAGGNTWHVQVGSVDFFLDDASFEPAARALGASADSELRAPFNGKVIAVKAQPGAKVSRGDTLLVIESMKLEHSLAAARDAIVKAIHVQPGQQAATSQVLVTFEATT